MSDSYDPAAVQRFAELLWRPGDVREVRILDLPRKATASGYFDDPARLAAAVAPYDGKGNMFLTYNPVDPALMAREQGDRIAEWAKLTTSDPDIVSRRWLYVDVDADRPSGVSGTDAELAAALDVARKVTGHLHDAGWGWAMALMSGNGHALVYPVDLPNDEESTRLVKGVLRHLQLFDTDKAHVDQSVFNPARISPLVGTLKVRVAPSRGGRIDGRSWCSSPRGSIPWRRISSDGWCRPGSLRRTTSSTPAPTPRRPPAGSG